MFNKRILAILAVIVATGVGYAFAQTYPPPQVTILHPNGDLIQVVPNGAPGPTNYYAPPALVTNVYGYYKSVPLTNFQYTFGPNVTYAQFAPSGTLATANITLAANPSDGARNCFFTTQTLTQVILSANTGQTVNNAVTAGVANTGYCYLYGASNATWDRD